MKLKIYEIDALVSEIINKIDISNKEKDISDDELEKELNKDVDFYKIKELHQKISKLENELEEKVNQYYDKHNLYRGRWFNISFDRVKEDSISIIRKKFRKKNGYITKTSQEVKNLIIINNNGDLNEIMNTVCAEIGI